MVRRDSNDAVHRNSDRRPALQLCILVDRTMGPDWHLTGTSLAPETAKTSFSSPERRMASTDDWARPIRFELLDYRSTQGQVSCTIAFPFETPNSFQHASTLLAPQHLSRPESPPNWQDPCSAAPRGQAATTSLSNCAPSLPPLALPGRARSITLDSCEHHATCP